MTSFPRSRIAACLMLVFALLMSGCSGAPTPLSPEPASGQASVVSTGAASSNSGLLGDVVSGTTTVLSSLLKIVSVTINGLLGGIVRNGDWTVTVPPGAYSGTGIVTIAIPDPSVRSCDLSISPASLNSFSTPVQLTCKLQTLDQVQTYVIQWWDPSAKQWVTLPTSRDTTKLTCSASLPHFSTYRCGKAGW